ncbi:MAG: hypothetical protein BGO31_06605 [Bacteroidetes bacterium 43-16]|nr:MAG: hypothetical protein BGO31_06605 [Bacteroidetes bacterium 43-16]
MLFLFLAETCIIACKCPEPNEFNYAYERLTVLSLDNSGSTAELSGSDSVRKQAYGIRVNIERILVAVQHDWHLGNLAYATTWNCLAREYNPANAIKMIKIITLNDFDASHPAGAELSDYFKKVDAGKFYDIETIYKQESQVFKSNFLEPLEADVLLTKAPEHSGLYTFVVETDLSDGTILKDTTSVQLY